MFLELFENMVILIKAVCHHKNTQIFFSCKNCKFHRKKNDKNFNILLKALIVGTR